MCDKSRILRFEYKESFIDVNVDVDSSNLLDVVIDYEDKAREMGLEIIRNPRFHYVSRMKHYRIQKDKDLMVMFDRLPAQAIENGESNSNKPVADFNLHTTDETLYARMILKTTAIRKEMMLITSSKTVSEKSKLKLSGGFTAIPKRNRQLKKSGGAVIESDDENTDSEDEDYIAETDNSSDKDSDSDKVGGYEEAHLNQENPECKGKDLNGHLYNTYGIYMKKSSLYNMKAYVIKNIYGGHDKSYAFLPGYVKMIHQTNPEHVAFYTTTEIGWRSLIGVNGRHLKGNYSGILLSAIALDANSEIFPLAYAVVSIENEDNRTFFFHNLWTYLKEAGRDDRTIISDRKKGVNLALKNVWPTNKRRYICRHLSRNFKKTFPGPLVYILFWKAPVMEWFAKLGH
ncbi:Protein FAR1-RELATED SEQUENCE 12 [Bienertia sinuspersici]